MRYGGHRRGGGLREALERGLLSGGVVRRSVLLLLLLLVGAHGLECELLPEETELGEPLVSSEENQ